MSQQSNTGGTSSRRHRREHDSSSVASARIADVSEWEANEALRQRQLEEARGRAAQMEKTMRWWSECTANWREKWSKVRNERNKAREECKQLRAKLESCVKMAADRRREVEELKAQNARLMQDCENDTATAAVTLVAEDTEEDKSRNVKENFSREDLDEEYLTQKMSMLQLRLEEATKTIQIEREEKSHLHRVIDKLTVELQELKERCEELKSAKQEVTRELLTLQDQHNEEIKLIKSDLQDEASNREGMDRKLNDLRTELERLQAENAAEWGKRERLETEKLALERDNKKLRTELRDMQERLERKGRPISNSDTEMRHLQQELSDKTKEIAELRHNQGKLKKLLQEKVTEQSHSVRRAEQYESEVKKLRSRVEELKREMANAEDELDVSANNVRKLQRTNDELQEQVDGFQVQLQHLHTRLRNCSSSSLLSHRGMMSEEDDCDEVNEY